MRTFGVVLLIAAMGGLVSACSSRCCPRRCEPNFVVKTPQKAPDAWAFLSEKYDADGDGAITPDEHGRGEKAFKALDHDRDGKLTAVDFDRPTRMDRYIARFTLLRYFHEDDDTARLDRDEVEASFAVIDTNGDGVLSARELEATRDAMKDVETTVPHMPPGVDPHYSLRQLADENKDGRLVLAELLVYFDINDKDNDEAWKLPVPPGGRMPMPPPGGIAEGKPAHDFTLKTPDGSETVTLSSFQGKRPVALIFGSYT